MTAGKKIEILVQNTKLYFWTMYSHMKSQNNVGIIKIEYHFDSLVITVLQEKPENFVIFFSKKILKTSLMIWKKKSRC